MRDNLYRARQDGDEYSSLPGEPRKTSLFLAAQMHPARDRDGAGGDRGGSWPPSVAARRVGRAARGPHGARPRAATSRGAAATATTGRSRSGLSAPATAPPRDGRRSGGGPEASRREAEPGQTSDTKARKIPTESERVSAARPFASSSALRGWPLAVAAHAGCSLPIARVFSPLSQSSPALPPRAGQGTLDPKPLPPLANPERSRGAGQGAVRTRDEPRAARGAGDRQLRQGLRRRRDGAAGRRRDLAGDAPVAQPQLGPSEADRFLERLAKRVPEINGWPGLLVGDISQPRGGPMLTGHASHQIGLDADIWLTPMPDRASHRPSGRRCRRRTWCGPDRLDIDPAVWTPAHPRSSARVAGAGGGAHLRQPGDQEGAVPRGRRGPRLAVEGPADVRPQLPFPHPPRLPGRARACADQDPPPGGDGCGAELALVHGGDAASETTAAAAADDDGAAAARVPARCWWRSRARGAQGVSSGERRDERPLASRPRRGSAEVGPWRLAALWPPSEIRSVSARTTPEPTKTRWMPTYQVRSRSEMFLRFMKALRTWMAEIATIEDMSFSLRPGEVDLAHPFGPVLVLARRRSSRRSSRSRRR